MAVYKVPQDVEADDKLIGPFSFRQFIYLLMVAGGIAIGWGLSRLFLPLAIIPLPIVVFFGALALPLRKDQPMEIYLAAMISFFLKPHKRLWDADGIDSLIEITVPKTVEVQRTKNLTQLEAQQRLGYLAELVDSQGWAVRGMGVQTPNTPMNSDVYFAAQQTEDILDNSNTVSQNLGYKLDQSDARRHQEVVDRIHKQAAEPLDAPMPQPSIQLPPQAPNIYTTFVQQPSVIPEPTQVPVVSTGSTIDPMTPPVYNPYPTAIQQSVIQPLDGIGTSVPTLRPQVIDPITPPVATSEKPISPDIMNLASNTDLSVETIAREANRIHEKEDLNDEVVIKLR